MEEGLMYLHYQLITNTQTQFQLYSIVMVLGTLMVDNALVSEAYYLNDQK